MGHKVTIFEQFKQLGGMLRYGIPSYRFPRELLDREINSILSLGSKYAQKPKSAKIFLSPISTPNYDCIYIAIGAHTDKKTGIEGEESEGVYSAVEILRQIGDDIYPDFHGKKIVVIGGGQRRHGRYALGHPLRR